MIRAALVILVGVLAVTARADDAKSDLDKLQGKWTVVSMVRAGKEAPEEATKNFGFVFEKDKAFMTRGEQKREFTFKLDPSKTPKWITVDIMGRAGEGLYSLEGDTLKICHGEGDNAPRPTELASKEGSNISLITLKRAK